MNQKQPGGQTDNRALDETIAPEESVDTNSDGDFSTEAIPPSLGRYEIIELLGRGGMGAVYLAHDSQLDRNVALKVPKFDSGTNPNLVSRFYREARSAANLSHPNLCPVFDVGEIDGTHYIAMAYIKGRPLSSYVNPEKPSAPRAIATIVRKVALGMEDAHQNGIIHRDLKPANIMIDHRTEPIVMDFGLACPQDLGDESRLTQDGALLGSPAYMSPEQLKGKSDAIGAASDVYSLGIVLYELLAGRLPYTGAGSTIAMISQVLTEDPIELRSVRSDIDAELAMVCEKAMNKDLDVRYGSMKEFATALGKYLQSSAGDKRLGEPTKTAKVTVSQIQLTEQSKLAKTMCESGQFVAAVSILKQIISNPDAKGSKMHQWAEAMLPKVEAQIAKQAQPKPKVVAAAASKPAAADNLFADLPALRAAAATAAGTTPYRRPGRKKSKTKSGRPIALISAVAAVVLLIVGGGAACFFFMGAKETPATANDPSATTPASTNATTALPDDRPIKPKSGQGRPFTKDPVFAAELLDLFDNNRDHQLDSTEIPPPVYGGMMAADANQDEWLSKPELASLDRSDFPKDLDQLPRPPTDARPPRFGDLSEFDKDADGQIELSGIHGPRRLALERADTDSNGVLDQNEIAILRQREGQRRRPGGPGRGGPGSGGPNRGEPPGDRPFRPGGRPGN